MNMFTSAVLGGIEYIIVGGYGWGSGTVGLTLKSYDYAEQSDVWENGSKKYINERRRYGKKDRNVYGQRDGYSYFSY